MAERIYDTGQGFTPTRREFTSPLVIPSMQSPALKDLVDAQVSALDKKTKTAQKNLAAFDTIQDSITGADFLSDENKAQYEHILSKRYGLDDDALGKFTAQDFTNPAKISQLNNQLDKALNDPNVKRLVESEIAAEEFYRNAQRIQDPDLHKKAMDDFDNALKEGERAMYGLDTKNYQPINLRKETHDYIMSLPADEEVITVQGDDGKMYPQKVEKRDKGTLIKEIKYLYESDPQFRKNFEAKYQGSTYDDIDDYANELAKQYAQVEKGTRGKAIEPDVYTLGTAKKEAGTWAQEEAIKWYANYIEEDETAKVNPETIQRIRQVVSNVDRTGEAKADRRIIWDALEAEFKAKGSETPSPDEDISEDKVPFFSGVKKNADLKDVRTYKDDLDLSEKIGGSDLSQENFNKVFGEGSYETMLQTIKDDDNQFKANLDKQTGELQTVNARWINEEYYNREPINTKEDLEEFKKVIDEDPFVDFVPQEAGRPAHFKIQVKDSEREGTEGEIKTEKVPLSEYSSNTDSMAGRANNPFNISDKGPENTEVVDAGVKRNQGVFPNLYEGFAAGVEKLNNILEGKSETYDPKMTLDEFGKTWTGGQTPNKGQILASVLKQIRPGLADEISEDKTIDELFNTVGLSMEDFSRALAFSEDGNVYEEMDNKGIIDNYFSKKEKKEGGISKAAKGFDEIFNTADSVVFNQ